MAVRGRGEDGLQEVLDLIVSAESSGHTHPTTDDGENSQDHERRKHDPGRFMDTVRMGGLAGVALGLHREGGGFAGMDGGSLVCLGRDHQDACSSKRSAPKKVLNHSRNM